MEAHHGTSLDGPQYPPEVWDGQLGLGVALGDTMPDKTFLHVPWYPLESEGWDGRDSLWSPRLRMCGKTPHHGTIEKYRYL